MKNFFLIFSILTCVPVFAQNLVQNGNFENDSCQIWQFQDLGGWFQLNTADYYHLSCAAQFTYKIPFKGRGCTGLYNGGFHVNPNTNDTFPSHEYIVGKLRAPLEAGSQYSVRFRVKPASYFDKPRENMTTDNISLAFINDMAELEDNRIAPWDIVINLEAHISNKNGLITDYDNYTLIEGCYTANGTERMVVIGNFSPYKETWIEPLDPSENIYTYSYFMIDEVEVKKMPDFLLPKDSTLCKGQMVSFSPDSSFSSFYVNGQLLSDSITLTPPGRFSFKAHYGACELEHSLRLSISPCEDCNFFVPNIFSPNGDGWNDKTLISSNCDFNILESVVFDRWGNQVYHSGKEFSWDGTHNGKFLSNGLYAYFIRIKIENSLQKKERLIKGDITLVR